MIGVFDVPGGCVNALGCDSPFGCGLFCRHRAGGEQHGPWGAAQAQNCNSLAAAGPGDPGAFQALLLAQQNSAYTQALAGGLAQQAAQETLAGLGTGLADLGGLAGGLLGLGGGFQQPAPVRPAVFDELPHDGIALGEVIGWRCWRVKKGLLQSTSFDHIWWPDRPMTGRIGDDYCGVHAFKGPNAARLMFEENVVGVRAWGAVALWGELVEHERGYRAENAAVVAIEAVRPSREGHVCGRATDRLRLRRLRSRYSVGAWADYQAQAS
jgi:hypothetical protein